MRDCRTKGETPLHRAAAFGDEESIQLLLDAGAAVDAKDSNGDTRSVGPVGICAPLRFSGRRFLDPPQIHRDARQSGRNATCLRCNARSFRRVTLVSLTAV